VTSPAPPSGRDRGESVITGHYILAKQEKLVQQFVYNTFPSGPCTLIRPLLHYASLRGAYALHASSLPSLPVLCSVTYNAGPFQGHGTIWNLSCTGWRLSGDLPMRPGETLSLTVTLPNKQRIEVPEAVVRWSRGQEFAVENVMIEPHIHARLQHYVKRLVREPERMSQLVLTAPNGNRRPF